jgi:hypothetical protein
MSTVVLLLLATQIASGILSVAGLPPSPYISDGRGENKDDDMAARNADTKEDFLEDHPAKQQIKRYLGYGQKAAEAALDTLAQINENSEGGQDKDAIRFIG